MTTPDSKDLLTEYVKTGSEAAFRELVARYINLVYSTAVRIMEGDSHRAKDIAQVVFMDLARQAHKLPCETMLGGWLHRATCFVAAKVARGEQRRRIRERQAAEMNELSNADTNLTHLGPILDEAINELGEEERKAILLRFYEQKDLRAVGEILGSSENAAQKRVSRALDQLRLVLKARGVALPLATLGTVLAGEVVTAAPAGLAASIAGPALAGALTGATLSSGAAGTLAHAIVMSKLNLAILGTVLAAGTLGLLLQQNTNSKLRTKVQDLQAQLQQGQSISPQAIVAGSVADGKELDITEILRLRGTISSLRNELAELSEKANRARTIRVVQDFKGLEHSIEPDEASLILTRDSLKDQGVDTPEAAVETYLWTERQAMSTNSLESASRRLKEITWIPAGATFAGYAENGQFDPLKGSDLGKIEAVAYTSPKTAEVYVALYDRNQGFTSGTIIKLVQEEQSWKIDFGLKPN